jgi:Kef-type K+ transport system membrane component KefB
LFLLGLGADLIGRFTALPRVTLLLLGGLAVGPSGLSLVPTGFVDEWFPALTTIALALIGFLLGHQFAVPAMKAHGKTIIVISTCKVFGAALAVGLVLWLVGANPVVALLLAAIAPATAPTATYDVVHEGGAHGEIVDALLSIVALDDVWGLLVFVLIVSVAGMLNGDTSVSSGLESSLTDIGGSLALGGLLGMPMAYLTGRIRRGEPTLAEAMGFVLLGAGIAEWLGLISILTAMAMGATVANLARHHERPFHAIEGVEWPFMILFFVLAGASLEIGALPLAGALTALYVLARCSGIYVGTRIGVRLADVDQSSYKWLGLALFPQAGVAIGMALMASQRFPEYGAVVLQVIITSTVVLEIVAPIVTRKALRLSGAYRAENNLS